MSKELLSRSDNDKGAKLAMRYLRQPLGPGTSWVFKMPTPPDLVGVPNPWAGKPFKKEIARGLGKAMKRYGQPQVMVTDRLRSYGAAMAIIGNRDKQRTGRWLNTRAENAHLPFQRQERHFISRDSFKRRRTATLTEWRQLWSA